MQPRRQYPQRKRTRLPAPEYAAPSAICSVTIATLDRSPMLADEALALGCVDLLIEKASTLGVTLHAYCFMPDHVHLLISPSTTISIIEFIRRFKSLSTRLAWDRGHHGLLWQRGSYDRFLRGDDDQRRVVEYMLNNPVRAGLVAEADAYPFSGWRRPDD